MYYADTGENASLVASSTLVDLCDNNRNDNDDDDDKQHNKQAPPLLTVPAARLLDRAADLGIRLDDIVVDLLALLLDVRNERFLLLHNLIQVLEQLGKLDHLTLNVLNCFVALFDIAESARSLTLTV